MVMDLLAWQFQSPGPILWEFGNITFRWYGFLIASAVLIGVTISQYLGKYRDFDPDLISDLVIWLVIGAIPCARIYYVIFQWQEYSQRPEDIIAIWQGGIAIHGAIIGGVIAGLLFAKLNRLSFWSIADIVAPSLILGQAIGRWGNFFNSEAFGRPTDLPWKLYIPPYHRPLDYVNYDFFHPTFLYESLWNIGIFAILISLFFFGLKYKEQFKKGTIFCVYLIGYSLGRVWIEGFRTDSLMLGDIRVAQLISLGLISIGVLGLVWLYLKKKSLPDTV